MYFDSQEDNKVIPWYHYPPHAGYSPNLYTPWVFGGSQSQVPNPEPDYNADYEVYPAEIRPLNKFVDPTATGRRMIELYVDPSDRTNTTSVIGQQISDPPDEMPSWQANGSSYTLNTRWAQGYAYPSGNFPFPASFDHTAGNPYGNRIAPYMVGGWAAQFIIWVEQGFYSNTYRAGPTIAGIGGGPAVQRVAWHRKFSSWVVGFADGHAKYGYFDTRQIYGLGGTIWQPGYRPY
jgi:hypothetical protein